MMRSEHLFMRTIPDSMAANAKPPGGSWIFNLFRLGTFDMFPSSRCCYTGTVSL